MDNIYNIYIDIHAYIFCSGLKCNKKTCTWLIKDILQFNNKLLSKMTYVKLEFICIMFSYIST